MTLQYQQQIEKKQQPNVEKGNFKATIGHIALQFPFFFFFLPS